MVLIPFHKNMKEIVLMTCEEMEEIIDNFFVRNLPKLMRPANQKEQKFLFSLCELADFLGCSVFTVRHFKKSVGVWYKQLKEL